MGRITSSGSIVSINNEYVPPSDMEEVLTDKTIVHPTPQAQVDSQSYVANTVDIQNAVPDDSKIIQAMAEYVSGIPVTVTFYHVINNDTFGRSFSTDFDRELDPVHTSYLKILNFQMRLKDSMQFNYEQESTISQQTGEAVLYPYFCPNIGDVFLYTLPNNRVGLFKIIEAPIRLAIHDTTHHEIKFKLMEFMSKAMQDKLEASVSEIAHFNLKRYLADSGALLTSNETDILNKANSCYTVLVNAYGEEFYNRDVYNTFIEDVRLYDPYIIEFISRIVETNKLPGYPTQLMANPVNWKRSFWYKLLDPKMVPDNILIHKAARTLYKVNYRTARINALANRHYLELDPNSEFSYPPFKIPCKYTDKVISIPMQVTLYLEQGKVRPSALMKLASDVLSMRRIARFYYIPIVLFLLKKLILALSSGKEDLILNDAIDSTCVQDCENCVYECDRNGDVVSCTLPEDAPPRYCAVIPACGGSTTDDDSTAHPPPWRTDGMAYSGGICNKVWRQAGCVNPTQPDSQVIRTDLFYTKEQIDGFIKTINYNIQRPDISTLPDETGIIASKVDKVIGKELSDNNFTTALKEKLDGINLDLKEDVANKATDFSVISDEKFPSIKAVADHVLDAITKHGLTASASMEELPVDVEEGSIGLVVAGGLYTFYQRSNTAWVAIECSELAGVSTALSAILGESVDGLPIWNDATTVVKGILRLASTEAVEAGIETNTAVTPATLNTELNRRDSIGVNVAAYVTLPSEFVDGKIIRLTTPDTVNKAPAGLYFYDSIGWVCLNCDAPYHLGNLGATPNITLIPGACYTANVDVEVTSFTVEFMRPGLCSITLTNAGELAVAQPSMAGRTSKLLAEGAWDGAATALSKTLIEDDGTYIIVSAGGLA